MESRLVVSRGMGDIGVTLSGQHKRSFWSWGSLYLDCGSGYANLYMINCIELHIKLLKFE